MDVPPPVFLLPCRRPAGREGPSSSASAPSSIRRRRSRAAAPAAPGEVVDDDDGADAKRGRRGSADDAAVDPQPFGRLRILLVMAREMDFMAGRHLFL